MFMKTQRSPSPSPTVEGKESPSGKRLSLAVAQLTNLIARLNHLPGLPYQIFSRDEGNPPLPHETTHTRKTL